MAPKLIVVRGGGAVRDEVRGWIGGARGELKRLILAALGTGDLHTAEQLMRCRDALGRLEFEFEFDDPNDPERLAQ